MLLLIILRGFETNFSIVIRENVQASSELREHTLATLGIQNKIHFFLRDHLWKHIDVEVAIDLHETSHNILSRRGGSSDIYILLDFIVMLSLSELQ